MLRPSDERGRSDVRFVMAMLAVGVLVAFIVQLLLGEIVVAELNRLIGEIAG